MKLVQIRLAMARVNHGLSGLVSQRAKWARRSVACFVYVLGSRAGDETRTYVGWTTDLDKRLAAHNAGKGARSTRGRDWRLLYAERFKNRGEAMSREWRLKRDRRFRKQVSTQNF